MRLKAVQVWKYQLWSEKQKGHFFSHRDICILYENKQTRNKKCAQSAIQKMCICENHSHEKKAWKKNCVKTLNRPQWILTFETKTLDLMEYPFKGIVCNI